MSLFDDLRSAAKALDPQFQVSSNEVTSVLSALVHYTEHGDSFLQAIESGANDVAELLHPASKDTEPSTAPASPVPTSTPPPGTSAVTGPAVSQIPSEAELEAQISDLQAQLTARQATDQQTQVEHETGPGPLEPPPEQSPAS